MTCPSCGNENAAGGVFCMRCGAPLQQTVGTQAPSPATPPPPGYGAQPAHSPGHAPAGMPEYAGFWLRFFAYVIDSIVMSIVFFMIMIPIGIIIGVAGAAGAVSMDEADLAFLEGPLMALYYVASISMQWLYEALLTASSKQATLGKMALGLVVTDMEGNRISFGRATGRFFAKIPSGLILMIGFLMQPFTAKKQALHDMLAGTLVVKRRQS